MEASGVGHQGMMVTLIRKLTDAVKASGTQLFQRLHQLKVKQVCTYTLCTYACKLTPFGPLRCISSFASWSNFWGKIDVFLSAFTSSLEIQLLSP